MVSLNAVCETRIASSRKTATVSRIMTCLRLEVLGGRVGTVCTTRFGGPATASQSQPAGNERTELIIDADAAAEESQVVQCAGERPAKSSSKTARYAGLGW